MIDPTHKVTRDELHHATGRDHHNVCWQYRGQRIGDYPPLHDVERAALQLAMMT